jgi:hypothetical protein
LKFAFPPKTLKGLVLVVAKQSAQKAARTVLQLQCGCALIDAKQKNKSIKAVHLFSALRLCFAFILNGGVPQTPESNAKVLLNVVRCAKLYFK